MPRNPFWRGPFVGCDSGAVDVVACAGLSVAALSAAGRHDADCFDSGCGSDSGFADGDCGCRCRLACHPIPHAFPLLVGRLDSRKVVIPSWVPFPADVATALLPETGLPTHYGLTVEPVDFDLFCSGNVFFLAGGLACGDLGGVGT